MPPDAGHHDSRGSGGEKRPPGVGSDGAFGGHTADEQSGRPLTFTSATPESDEPAKAVHRSRSAR